MQVLYVTSEAFPLAKTGGLADVSASLPAALRGLDIDIRILLPGYPRALEAAPGLQEVAWPRKPLMGHEFRLLETHLPDSRVPVWLIDCPTLYRRAGGPYQDDAGNNWHDNVVRFGLLNHVAARIAAEGVPDAGAEWLPDIVHAHDWHAGLVPLLLPRASDRRPATLLTIHNLAYQGIFGADTLAQLALSGEAQPSLEHYGQISFLKAGIQTADAITTVSPTYAKEILKPEFGCGMDDVLRGRSSDLTGVLNGIDDKIWDPATDPYLAHNYSLKAMANKSSCKRAVQSLLGLDQKSGGPLVAFMSRLVPQKMPDIVLEALPALLEGGIQFVLLAEGENHYEESFRQLAMRYPGQIAVRIGYCEALAHQIQAGADMLLHPSRFEPCGLVPIYAMRYGTIPLVRRSGGLADSVTEATPETIRQGTASGLFFDHPTAHELIECTRRAQTLYNQPIAWRKVQTSAMAQDFSWRRSAGVYADIYRALARPSEEKLEREKIRASAA